MQPGTRQYLLVDLLLLEHLVVEEKLTENHRSLVLDLQSDDDGVIVRNLK